MFQNQLEILPPPCGKRQGSWIHPDDQRVLMRWENDKKHGLRFAVDSAETGNGSVFFGRIEPKLSLRGYQFDLLNCNNKAPFRIEEEIIKVDKMGKYDQSQPHDATNDKTQFLLKYTVISGDNKLLLETNRFRVGSNTVQFWTASGDGLRTEKIFESVANASRSGAWKGREWRSCARTGRKWHLTFKEKDPLPDGPISAQATLLDARIAATAVLNLMAARDEDRSSETGFSDTGENELWLNLGKACLLALQVCLICCCCCVLCIVTGLKKKVQKILLELEHAAMSKGCHNHREAPLNPTY
jgi:hypothetical protein